MKKLTLSECVTLAEEIRQKVNYTLAEEFEVDESKISPEGAIKDVLSLDSLSLVDLVAVVNYTFKIKIPTEDLRKIETFNDLYDYIEQRAK